MKARPIGAAKPPEVPTKEMDQGQQVNEPVELGRALGHEVQSIPMKIYPFHTGMNHEDFIERFNRIIWLKENLMKQQIHYGVTPKTGDKPSLYQPGAQMLCIIFQLAPNYMREVREVDGDFMFDLTCTLTHYPTGYVIGQGIGGGSTGEKRYHKKPAHDAYNMAAKMSAKRSYVAATISCVGVSEVFTQDLEDHPEFFGEMDGPPGAQDDLPGLPTSREKMPEAPSHELRFEGMMDNTQFIAEKTEWWCSIKTRYFWTGDETLGERMMDYADIPVVVTAIQNTQNPNLYRVIDLERMPAKR
jgi:hypothetical protein